MSSRHHAAPRNGRNAVQTSTIEENAPTLKRHHVRDQIEHGRFPSAIRTDQTRDRPSLNLERTVVNRAEPAERAHRVLNLKNRLRQSRITLSPVASTRFVIPAKAGIQWGQGNGGADQISAQRILYTFAKRLYRCAEYPNSHPISLEKLAMASKNGRNETIDLTPEDVLGTEHSAKLREISTHADGPAGAVPFTADFLTNSPSGDHFGMSQNAGMGWNPAELMRKQFIILATAGGLREEDGTPVALGLHTGHFELASMVKAAAGEFDRLNGLPFATFCSDPCDGRTQGTTGMMDSLPYRNDAAQVFRRQARSLPTAKGVLGIASCDKGLPAMMMALAGLRDKPVVIVPGGVTLAPKTGEDAGMIQSIGARFAQGEVTLEYAQDVGCRACASPGGGCQFLGTAGTSQVVSEALGLAITHGALSPSGTPAWFDVAVRSARALVMAEKRGIKSSDILTDAAFENAMVVHAACGGSTNLLLHTPAIAHAAGRHRMDVDDWQRVNDEVPRIVDVLPTARSATRPRNSTPPEASPKSCSTSATSGSSTPPS